LSSPAYKDIPLATATADKLAELDPERFSECSYSFDWIDWKEAKHHGEGGVIVGGELKGKRIVITDDVVTAGTAKRQAIELIRREDGTLVATIVMLDRQEKMPAGEGEDDEDGKPRERERLRRTGAKHRASDQMGEEVVTWYNNAMIPLDYD